MFHNIDEITSAKLKRSFLLLNKDICLILQFVSAYFCRNKLSTQFAAHAAPCRNVSMEPNSLDPSLIQCPCV